MASRRNKKRKLRFGETAVEKPPRYWHAEYSIVYLALQLGRPLLGFLRVLAFHSHIAPERDGAYAVFGLAPPDPHQYGAESH